MTFWHAAAIVAAGIGAGIANAIVGSGTLITFPTLLAVASLGVYFWRGASGLDAAAFLVVLALSVFSMWRVWRDAHTY